MKIILTGGGTGGHLFPLLAVAEKLKEKLGSECEFLYVGSGAPLEKEVIQQAGIPMKNVFSGKIRRYFSFLNFVDMLKLPLGFLQSLWILLRFMPDVVFSKGGYVAVPVVLAAWVYRIPVLIHESDSIPGVANKFLGNYATRIAVAYKSAEKYFPAQKVALVGNPVRKEILKGNGISFRRQFNLTMDKPLVLVVGGSQGALALNRAIGRILPKLLHEAQVVHVVGEKNFVQAEQLAMQEGIKINHDGYFVFKFLSGSLMGDALAAADLVVSRSGANSISEIAAHGKLAILVPLDGAANDHQRKNAYELADIGAAAVLEEGNLGENMLLHKIETMLKDKEGAVRQVEMLKNFYHPQAAEKIARGIIELKD